MSFTLRDEIVGFTDVSQYIFQGINYPILILYNFLMQGRPFVKEGMHTKDLAVNDSQAKIHISFSCR